MKHYIVVAAILLAVSRAAPAQDVKESDYELEEAATVSVDSAVGAIRLSGSDRPLAHLKAVKRGRDAEKVTFEVTSDKKSLRVVTKFPERQANGNNFNFGGNNFGNGVSVVNGLEVDIQIELLVPKTLKSLILRTVSGTISVHGAQAKETKVSSTSGGVQADGLRGDLAVDVISGNVQIANLVGTRAAVTSTSGSVTGSAQIKSLEIKGVSTSVSFALTPPQEGEWSAKVSVISGEVSLRVPRSAGAALHWTTQSGGVSCGFDLKEKKQSDSRFPPHSLDGTFGNGAGSIRMSTISGAITLSPLD
jgi:DUF4097 and DUF4098 domain-containing protein YvlB